MLLSLIFCLFLMKILKFRKMSHWNELSSIAGKWQFCCIYWEWILIEQTFLYTLVYKTFLYNPTNLKVPKKAPCQATFWINLWHCIYPKDSEFIPSHVDFFSFPREYKTTCPHDLLHGRVWETFENLHMYETSMQPFTSVECSYSS